MNELLEELNQNMFQFLIGSLESGTNLCSYYMPPLFQFLIGSLESQRDNNLIEPTHKCFNSL